MRTGHQAGSTLLRQSFKSGGSCALKPLGAASATDQQLFALTVVTENYCSTSNYQQITVVTTNRQREKKQTMSALSAISFPPIQKEARLHCSLHITHTPRRFTVSSISPQHLGLETRAGIQMLHGHEHATPEADINYCMMAVCYHVATVNVPTYLPLL